MLLGTYQVKVASGRRVFIPQKLRKDLSQNLILAKWYEGCLVLIAKDNWQALYKRLTGKKEIIIGPIRDTERFILGSAYEIDIDDQGRMVIPENLNNYANLGEIISFVGLINRVEIWDAGIWEEKQRELSKVGADLIERLGTVERLENAK